MNTDKTDMCLGLFWEGPVPLPFTFPQPVFAAETQKTDNQKRREPEA